MSLATFICRDEEERAWLLDMHRRTVPVERISIAIVGIPLLLMVPWFPPAAIVPMVLACAIFFAGSFAVRRMRRIEPLVAAWFASTGLIMVAVVEAALARPLDGAAISVGSALLVWPMLGACGGLPTRVVAACAAWCCALVIGCTLALFAPEVRDYPPILVLPLIIIVASAVISSAVRRASMEHRSAAVVDQLTGMLNRAALTARANELAHQSRLTGERVGVIVVDLDHFKRINDQHGHAVGDRVLQEVAYRMRTQLRAFDLAYRLGGEEFIVLLPGADEADARRIADELWSAIRCTPVSGLPVTASLGVAVSPPGEVFRFETTFHVADEALYAAKTAGRDRVTEATVRLAAA